MKRPAIFFDRDNTLIACDEYLGDASKVELIDGAADAVARARKLGYATVTVSNQSGVARGYFAEAAVHAVNQRMDEMLLEANAKAVIDRHEFCPFHPDAAIAKYRSESPLRKPAPGMLLSAAEALAIDLSRSWMIGDAPRDIEAGAAAGCRTILFMSPTLKQSPAALAEKKVEPDYVCSTLKEAMDFVEKNTEIKDEGGEVKDEGGRKKDEEDASVGNAPTVVATPGHLPLSGNPRRDEVAKPDEPAVEEKTSTLRVDRDAGVASTEEAEKAVAPVSTARLEALAEQILYEMRRRHEQPHADFSVSKLMAGIVQVIVFFVLFLAYLNKGQPNELLTTLMFATVMQAMTIALLIMSRQH